MIQAQHTITSAFEILPVSGVLAGWEWQPLWWRLPGLVSGLVLDSPGEPILAEEAPATITWDPISLPHVGWSLVLVLQVSNVRAIHFDSSCNQGQAQVHLELAHTSSK